MVWIFLFICSFILFLFLVSAIIRTITLFFGAPFVQSNTSKVETITRIVQNQKYEKMADLGSGDGRLSFALAPYAKEIHGYEINPLLVWRARREAKKLGLSHKVFFHWQSFWDADLTPFDLIVFYQITYVMKNLEHKLDSELKPGSIVISNYFQFPHWKTLKRVNEVSIYKR